MEMVTDSEHDCLWENPTSILLDGASYEKFSFA